jgi:hypothetical protein
MKTKLIAHPDLAQRPPRSPRVRLGDYVLLARILDKGRASLAGKPGDYEFDCSMDQHFFHFTGITAESLKAELATGKGDGEILAWVQASAPIKHEPWEIQQWSAYHTERGPDGDAETLTFFAERVGAMSKTRPDIRSWFDFLDLDDHTTFGGLA